MSADMKWRREVRAMAESEGLTVERMARSSRGRKPAACRCRATWQPPRSPAVPAGIARRWKRALASDVWRGR